MRVDFALAQRYAEALVNVVADDGQFELVDEQLQQILRIVREHPGIEAVMEDPSLSRSQKGAFVADILEMVEPVDAVWGLMNLLVQKERFGLLGSLVRSYRTLYRERLGIVEVDVKTAINLSSEQIDRISKLVQKMTGKTPYIQQENTPDILGGLVIEVGNKVLDNSIRNQLEEIRRSLVAGEAV